MRNGIQVYLVEDEPLIALEIQDRLTRLGYTVCGRARSGEQLLEDLERTRPHLILLDIRLAGQLSGIEVAFQLREAHDIPVVFLSAFSSDDLLQRALQAEPFGYLVKPFGERELHVTIQAALTKHNLERSLRLATARLEAQNAELAESQRFNDSLLQALDVQILALNARGRILETNAERDEFLGARLAAGDDYLARCDAAARAGDEGAAALAAALREVCDGRRESFRQEFRRAERALLTRITRFPGEGPTRLVLTHDDVTNQKRVGLAVDALSQDLAQLEGLPFRRAACQRLSTLLEADAVFLCQPGRHGDADSIALILEGNLGADVAFPGEWRPFGAVSETLVVEAGLADRLPDPFLREGGFEACVAHPLSGDQDLGYLGVLFRHPIREREPVLAVVKLFADTIATGLLREHHRRQYEDLVELMPAGLVLADLEGRIVLANRRTEELFGWTREELIGQPVEKLIPPSSRGDHLRLREAYRQDSALQPKSSPRGPLRGFRKDRSSFPVEIHLAPVETESGVLIAAAIQDISERAGLRHQLAEAQKLDALGKLTGGLAHDFNNYLNVILGNLDLLLTRDLDPDARGLVHEAARGASAGADLTRSLLAFARKSRLEPRPTSPNERIRGVAGLLARTLGEDLRIDTELDPTAWTIFVDAPQLDSCLVNLANNARDAMPKGGRLTIRTRNILLSSARHGLDLEPGPYLVIEVSDSGVGIQPELTQQVLEPFYTTKAPGHGTGLGLSMVFGFVKQSGGDLQLVSEPGHGTTVRLYLPPERSEIAERCSSAAPQPPPGSETVLVVEDNPDVRQTVVRQLRSLGYQVVEAQDGEQALDRLQDADDIDLVLTDVVMPGSVNGYDLLRWVRGARPQVQALLTSGFPGEAPTDLPPTAILAKPYRRSELARAVRASLDAPK